MAADGILPNVDHVAPTLAIVLCRDVSGVEHAQILFVERDRFRRCALLRKEV